MQTNTLPPLSFLGSRSTSWFTRGCLLTALTLAPACGDDDASSSTTGDAGDSPITGQTAVPDAEVDATPPTNNNNTNTNNNNTNTNNNNTNNNQQTADGGAPPQPGDGGTGPTTVVVPPAPANALYAVGTWVTAGDVATTYIQTVPRLDVDVKIDLTNALETPGYGDVRVEGDKLFVSSGEAPIVTRYTIDAQGKYTKDGDVNFEVYTSYADIYKQAFISPTKAYLSADDGWVKWNPVTLKIEGTIPYPESIVPRDGLDPYFAFDRGFIVRGDRAYHAVAWFDFDNYESTPNSAIVVLDTVNDKVLSVIDAPCPYLDVATTDDYGNIYYSSWVFTPGATLINGGAKSCAVKIPVGSDALDPNWKLVLADVTGGHEAAAMRYIGNNKVLMAVFHEELAPYNPRRDTIDEWVLRDAWTYATLDLTTREFRELTSLGYHNGGYYSASIAGQFFLLTASSEGDSTTFLQLLSDGTAKKGITVDGWSSRAHRIR